MKKAKICKSLFGKRFKCFRLLAGYSQEEAANKLCVSRSTLACYETNRFDPPIATLIKMSQLYNQSIDYLLGSPSMYARVEKRMDRTYRELVNRLKQPTFDYEEIKKLLFPYCSLMKINKK